MARKKWYYLGDIHSDDVVKKLAFLRSQPNRANRPFGRVFQTRKAKNPFYAERGWRSIWKRIK